MQATPAASVRCTAHALQLGLTLVTRNEKHFGRARGLEIADGY